MEKEGKYPEHVGREVSSPEMHEYGALVLSRDGDRLGVDYRKSLKTVFTEVLNVVYNAQDWAGHMRYEALG
jgi:hypothetical protein